jgi:hypothetical protein
MTDMTHRMFSMLAFAALVLVGPVASADKAAPPPLPVDGSVFLDDLVIVAKSQPALASQIGITETIASAPVSLSEWTDGLVNGDADSGLASDEGFRAVVDQELNRATRAVRTR